jgi:hypothetical protein
MSITGTASYRDGRVVRSFGGMKGTVMEYGEDASPWMK